MYPIGIELVEICFCYNEQLLNTVCASTTELVDSNVENIFFFARYVQSIEMFNAPVGARAFMLKRSPLK